MDRRVYVWLLVFLSSVMQLHAKDLDLYCGACHMLVDEISWEISQTDPKKTIQKGSFRIMPDGSQRLNEIPYKQSVVQLTELLETACVKPGDYYQTTEDGRKIYKRQSRRDGRPSALSNILISRETNKMLKFACEGVAEDFEEEIIEAFKNKEDDNYLQSICVDIAGMCSEAQLYEVEPDMVEESERSKKDSGDNEESEDENESDEEESDTEDNNDAEDIKDAKDIKDADNHKSEL